MRPFASGNRTVHAAAQLVAVAWLVSLGLNRVEAHKTITSKYTYSDVFPILKARCGQCHAPGGPTPMSLLTYEEAVPWAESIREQLVAETMPPWPVAAEGPAVQGGAVITARELDTLVTWATGGTPKGDQPTPAPEPVPSHWRAGAPDALITMPSAHVLPPGVTEEHQEYVLPTGFTEPKWVRAIDLLPGLPSIVRAAVVALDNGRVLCAWLPGQELISAPSGTGFLIPAGAKLHLKIHYKKNWQDEQIEKSDRSTLGLYFAGSDAPIKALEELTAEVPFEKAGEGLRGTGTAIDAPARLLALRPSVDQTFGELSVDALLPSGQRVPLLRLHAAQPQWYRRYWLATPVELPRGTRVEVIATPPGRETTQQPAPTPPQYVRLALDFVAR